MAEELQVGDEIIVEGYRFPMVVASVGDKLVRVRIRNFPFLFTVRKDKVIWRTGQPFEQVMRGLKGIKGYEPEIALKKKRQLRGLT